VSVLPASAIALDAATLRGVVLPRGKSTTWHFEYGTTTAYGASTTAATTARARLVRFRVSGLTAATTYHYRLVATSAAGTTTSPDRTFTTRRIVQPMATTLPAGRVTTANAMLRGVLLPGGQTTVWRFQYGTTDAYGFLTPLRRAGRVRLTAAEIGKLSPGTTYHFRLVAMNAAGTTAGADMTFTTPPAA
jgi:hypothetical protein